MPDYVVNDKCYSSRKENIGEEFERINATTAMSIFNNIRSIKFVMENYPKNEDIEDFGKSIDWLSRYFTMFFRIYLNTP